jgi:hypothetical protein
MPRCTPEGADTEDVGAAIVIAAVLSVVPACPTDGQVRPSFVGDVDGDGRPDRVFVRAAPARCAFHLVVVRRHGRALVAPLRWPVVVALAPIDRRPGAEIVFTDHVGASMAFLGVYTVRRHVLVRMRGVVFPVSPGPYFGSVDCAGRLVVSTTAELRNMRLHVERRFYRVVGDEFRLVRTRDGGSTRLASTRPFRLCRSP